jgi:hypothetical protein
MSRLAQAHKAVRPALKGRMMLSGPPGAGKTWSALLIGTELAAGGPILVIDTERESALTYADVFQFNHLPWAPPFTPPELVDVLREASGQYAVIIIDSFSHFWRGEGGVLDVAGGKFSGWKEARPQHEALLQAILACDAHVILGVRSKVEYVQEVENGRHVVRKLGMADQQDDNLSFELNVALDLAMDHSATVSKSRTPALPVGRMYGQERTVEMAAAYRDWLASGAPAVVSAKDAKWRLVLACREAGWGVEDAKVEAGRIWNGRSEDAIGEADLAALTASVVPPTSDEGPVPDLGVPGDEPVASASDTAQEPAPGDPPADEHGPLPPDPEVAASAGLDKPKARRAARTPAEQIHRDLGILGFGSAEQKEIIFCASGGQSEHASEMDETGISAAYFMGKDIAEGRTTMEAVRSANDDQRSKVLEEQLAASIAAQAGERAVADFEQRTGLGSGERVAS